MLLISILFLHSNSLKGLGGFVILDANHTLTLSPQAKNLVNNVTFLVLITGDAGSDTDFITNTLLRGKVPMMNNERTPIGDDFRFHEKVPLAKFCSQWKIKCEPDQPNVSLVFIDAGGDWTDDQDVLQGIHALSSIVSFRIHVMADGSPQKLMPLLEKTDLRALSIDGLVPYGVAIVFPRTEIPGMTEKTRKAQDANLTKSFHRECMSSTSAVNSSKVFGQPDARQSADLYLRSMGEIANLIVPRARGALLPHDNLMKVFETAARLVQKIGIGKAPIHSVLSEIADQQWNLILTQVATNHTEPARRRLLNDQMAFETVIEILEMEEPVINESYRRVNALPPQLRDLIRTDRINDTIKIFLEETLKTFQDFFKPRQERLKYRFMMTCSTNAAKVINKTKERYDWALTVWDPKTVASAKLDFTEAVGYEKLPPTMRETVMFIYNNYLQSVTVGVEGHTQRKNNWFFYLPCFIVLYAFIKIIRRVEATFKLLKGLKEAWDGVRACWKKCQKVMKGSKESDKGDQQSFPTPEDDGLKEE
jgi:hypothetical protein